MTLLTDPDLWLFARLSGGSTMRQRAGTTGTTLLFILMLYAVARFTAAGYSELLIGVALFGLGFGPAFAITRLVALDRDGRLDYTRLCGRRPLRTFACAWIAIATPPLVIGCAAFAAYWWIGGATAFGTRADVLALAVFVFLVGSALPLLYFEMSAIVTLVAAIGAFWSVVMIARQVRLAPFLLPLLDLEAACLLLFTLLFVGGRMARPPQSRQADMLARVSRGLTKWIPRDLPPELYRSLIATLRSRDGIGFVAPGCVLFFATAVLVEAPTRALLVFYEATVALILAGLLAASLVGRDIASGAAGLACLTRQSHSAIVFGWMAGPSIAFYLAAPAALAMVASDPVVPVIVQPMPLLAVAAAMPAIGVLQALQRRRAAYVVTAVIMATVVIVLTEERWITRLDTARLFGAAALIAAVSFVASVGRLGRPEGPALRGGAALASIGVAALLVVMIPLAAHRQLGTELDLPTRVALAALNLDVMAVPAVLALFVTPLISHERQPLVALWPRLRGPVLVATLAGASVAAISGGDLMIAVATGLLAGATLVLSVALHELCWPATTLSLALRLLFVIVLLIGRRTPGAAIVLAVAAAAAAMWMHHSRVRQARAALNVATVS